MDNKQTDWIGLINSTDFLMHGSTTSRVTYASLIIDRLYSVQNLCHGIAAESGWWTDMGTGEDLTTQGFGMTRERGELKINVPEKLMLIVSEAGEAMEGFRKNKVDEHLHHRMNFEIELADLVIRVFDLAGGLGLDLPGAIVEKLRFNTKRPDHKLENRQKADGKKF